MLINPSRRRKRSGAKRPRSAAQKAATKRMLAARRAMLGNPKRRNLAANPKRHTGGGMPGRRKASAGRGRVVVVNPRRRRRHHVRRRSYRRNPGLSVKSVTGLVTHAAIGSVAVLAGKWGSGYLGKYVGNMIPTVSANTLIQQSFGQAIVATLVTIAAGKLAPAKYVPFIAGGAFMSPVESILRSFNIDFINQGLAAYPTLPRNGMAAYPQVGPGMGVYPQQRVARFAGDPQSANLRNAQQYA